MLICYICSLPFSSVKFYLNHLRLSHAIHHIGVAVNCEQNSCPRTFTNFRYLKTHLEKEHSNLINSDFSNAYATVTNVIENTGENIANLAGNIENHDSNDDHMSDDSQSELLPKPVNLTSSEMSFICQLQRRICH